MSFIWHYIDVVEKGVTFLAHPVQAKTLDHRADYNERRCTTLISSLEAIDGDHKQVTFCTYQVRQNKVAP